MFLTLGYAPYSQAWLAWLALAPVSFYFILERQTFWSAFQLGYFLGMVHFLSSLLWLTQVSCLGWCVLSAYLAVYPALWVVFWNGRVKSMQAYTSTAILCCAAEGAFVWIILEWARGWMFTGFGWNALGVTQHAVWPLIQIADLGGVALISWIVAFVNFIFALHLRRLQLELKRIQSLKPRLDLIVMIALLSLCFVYGVRRMYESFPLKTHLRFLAVQPAIPQDPWKPVPASEALGTMKQLTLQGLAAAPIDLIVWPETPMAASVLAHSTFRAIAQEIIQDRRNALLLGSNDYVYNKVYNAAMLLQNGTAQIYHKQHLVLMGEYVPFSKQLPFLRRFVPEGIDFSHGKSPEILRLANTDLKIAPLICFEDTLSDVVRKSLPLRPDLLINLTNDGWFRRSAAAQQHMDNALFRAVEYRLPMLRVTNNGITAVISEKGIPIQIFRSASGDLHGSGWMKESLAIPLRDSSTFYAQWGNWVPSLGVFFLILMFAKEYWLWRKKVSKVFL